MSNPEVPVDDELWPDRRVSKFFSVHPKTINRWEKNAALNFPDAVEINGLKYRYKSTIVAWAKSRIRKRDQQPKPKSHLLHNKLSTQHGRLSRPSSNVRRR